LLDRKGRRGSKKKLTPYKRQLIRIAANHGKWPHEIDELDEYQISELMAHYQEEPCGVPWLAISAIIQAIYATVGIRTDLEDFAYMPLGWPIEHKPQTFESIVNQFRFAGLVTKEAK